VVECDVPDGGAAVTGLFCGVVSNEIDLSGLCSTGCQSGEVIMTGTAAGLTITADHIYSNSPVFRANPVSKTLDGKDCVGFSATDPQNQQPYTSLSIGIKNNMNTAQTIKLTLEDLASGPVPLQYKLEGAISVPAQSTVEQTLRWGTAGSRCSQSDAGNCTEFSPLCTLPEGFNFDPTHLLKLGLSVGDASTAYPITNVDILVTSLAFN
jgi:hypothetical protein